VGVQLGEALPWPKIGRSSPLSVTGVGTLRSGQCTRNAGLRVAGCQRPLLPGHVRMRQFCVSGLAGLIAECGGACMYALYGIV
jgi:hypothetical protein